MNIGRSVDRVEARAKVTGGATYTADVAVPGVAHAVLVQAAIPHGEVVTTALQAATTSAERAPGVLRVLTPLNCPALRPPPEDMSDDLPLERRPPLSDLTVQHVGQHLAVVVADRWEDAVHAAESMKLDYVAYPAQLCAREVMSAGYDGSLDVGAVRHGSYRPHHFVKLESELLQDHRGAPDAPNGAHVVRAEFTTPEHAHYPMELAATIAEWDDDGLLVHDTTRWITGERRALAAYLGLPEDRIRIRSPLVGGAFGAKSFLWMHVALCAVAAREVGRPVKLVLSRDQMFTSTGHRPRTAQRVVLVADESARLQSTEHHTLSETSTIAHFCEPAGLSTRFLYQTPRLATSHTVARINSPTPCFMRGPGEAPGLFALEVAMDELAVETGIDPIELRLRNDPDTDQASGRGWSTKHLGQCWSQAAERFGWSARPLAPRSLRRGDVMLGWGAATATYPGRRMPAGCRVTTTPDGLVHFASATHELGTGVRTVMSQVAADAAGLPLERVAFDSGDSTFPDAPYSGASQTTATVGSAVHEAGLEWRRRAASGEPLNFTITAGGTDDTGPVSQSFGAHLCEVEVDERLGRISVTRWVAVLDCGRVLNPKLARNQVMGGILFGLGAALMERVAHDPVTARVLGEYYVPTHADVPDFDITFLDAPDYGLDPLGVRGVGELGTCGVPAAIANAVFHATGTRLRDLPITLEHVLIPFDDEDS